MFQKIAVAVIHGIGKQELDFANGMIEELRERFAGHLESVVEDPAVQLLIEPIYWAPALQNLEDDLWNRMRQGGDMDFIKLRRFMVDFAADAIAYQPTPNDRQIYDNIHEIFANVLKKLATTAGPRSPLCVIAHSLGTVIASNYFYDLYHDFQMKIGKKLIADKIIQKMGNTPLELGETLTLFYTLGSPIAIWSLRYDKPRFGVPIQVPSPLLKNHHPTLQGEWVNFYDEDDVIGYPLKTLNDEYHKAVKADRVINAGGFLSSWNPLSHLGYLTDNDVTKPIAKALADTWKVVNL